MHIRPDSIVKLHTLYHRKEEGKYIIGNPETGDFMVVTPAEFRCLQLIHSDLTPNHIEELLRAEKDKADVYQFLHELREHGFIYKVDNHVIVPKHEPLHEFTFNLKGLGSRTVLFLLIVISLFGLWTLIWRGSIPGFTVFFFQPYLSITLLTVIVVSWLLIAIRQLMKYAATQYLNIPTRFGFSTYYHAFIPKVYTAEVTEKQEHYIVGMSLLSLTALASIALLFATYLHYPANLFWSLVFTLAFIEILAECLLFLDTDLARFITASLNIHKLNKQTEKILKEDLKLFWHAKGAKARPVVTEYSFFYIASILLAVILLLIYVLPALTGFLVLGFLRLVPGDQYFADAFIALMFFSVDLLLYGFALLKHHHLAHNKFFVNMSLGAIVVASYILAAVGVLWFSTGDPYFTVILCYALGVLLAVLFEAAVRFAHPFSDQHHLFEAVFLPIIAACIPILIPLVVQSANVYAYAFSLGVGMLTAMVLSQFSRTVPRPA